MITRDTWGLGRGGVINLSLPLLTTKELLYREPVSNANPVNIGYLQW